MHTIQIITEFTGNAQQVINGFTQELFMALKPPFVPMQLLRFDGCNIADEVHLLLGIAPIRQKWVSIIVESEQKDTYLRFVDKGVVLPFPFSDWRHEHIVMQRPGGIVRIEDNISYATKPKVAASLLHPLLLLQFGYRKKAYPRFFQGRLTKSSAD